MRANQIPRSPDSIWLTEASQSTFPKLEQDLEVDVAIIGAGTTGVTAAYLLSQAGLGVALIEANHVLHGTTGYTTAKISSQHGALYHKLIKQAGEEKARLYYEANENALNFIRELVEKENIDAELETKDAFIYATSESYVEKIKNEADAYQQLGIKGILEEGDVGLPFDVLKSLRLPNQAQFHPVKFFGGLVPSILKNGGQIYEGTRIETVKGKRNPTAITTDGYTIKSKHCIVSSHFPLNDKTGLYFTRLHAQRSYCLAVEPKSDLPDGMSLNIEPNGTSLRSATGPSGEPLLLIGGAGHTAGKIEDSSFQSYEQLKQFGEKWFGVEDIPYRWSSQDLITLDSIPYIGQNVAGEDHIYVATGFGKWGMTNGVAAALLIRDLILDQDNQYTTLYDPLRTKLKKTSIASFVQENTDVTKEFVKGKVQKRDKELEDLENNKGAVIKYNGKQTGAYKDEQGNAHLLNITCTHMGCTLNWNDAERSWDCPCHGGRFSYTGEVLEGLPTKPLDRVK
ncbi:FAD-dependent oxidoreductase [Alkalicoccobacillus porphyridii]|uniref:FAD-dependent oxidoreductase n=1 Tax=Alkalicoccobacillus porphyridii TaxID=2597270 RepID=A0A554A170_9BACI|nr:FAD-dependent oxidoreductase [Alkalicoccobacillus porphyridii]TSB47442.1 FAD-dependent oxidoreductase [Alkalicoccobacillus porphyridii]